MLGVMYPLIYEFIYNQKISVGAPFYNAIFVPITLLACIFMYFSIDSKWQQKLKIDLFKNPSIISSVMAIMVVIFVKYKFLISDFWTLASIFIGMMIITRYIFVIFDYLVLKKFTNIYSITAHIGLGLLIIAIGLNNDLSKERALNVQINDSDFYNNYEFTFDNMKLVSGPNYDSVIADFIVKDKAGNEFMLSPEKRKYFVRGQITTETAIHVTPFKDIYMTIGDQLDDGSWIVNIQFNYFIRWIWFSAILMIISGIFLAYSLSRKRS
jgi:cytochrome c-type biogenesis protein CcmF